MDTKILQSPIQKVSLREKETEPTNTKANLKLNLRAVSVNLLGNKYACDYNDTSDGDDGMPGTDGTDCRNPSN